MRLPSLVHVFSSARSAAARFPLAVLCGILTAAVGVLASMRGADAEIWLRIGAATTLGLPMFVLFTVAADRDANGKVGLWMLRIAGIALLVSLWWAWPAWPEGIRVRRYFQFSLCLHLAVAVLPFLLARSSNGFWHYNRILFLRFLTSALYSAVLFAGLSIAIMAIDNLFGVKIHERVYFRLWFVIAFIFNTWYFVGGIPDDLEDLEGRREYPAGLRIFSQYILVPLVTVYLTILTVYLGRVVLTGHWPSGWIGWLVSSVATAGILSLLLIHPIRDQANQRWARTYARVFYVALLPSIVMLLLAIGKRIQQYGITEDRYFLVVLALWLSGIALFFIVRRNGDIRVIPATLCALAVITAFGPWGAFSMSRASQTARLATILDRHGLVEDRQFVEAADEVPFDDRKEISAILFYLLERHGPGALEAIAADTVHTELMDHGTTKRWQRHTAATNAAARLMERMGIAYLGRHAQAVPESWNFSIVQREAFERIGAYDLRLPLPGRPSFVTDIDGVTTEVHFDGRARTFIVRYAGREVRLPAAAAFDSAQRHKQGVAHEPVPLRWMTFEGGSDSLRARLQLDNIHGVFAADTLDVRFMNGTLYLGGVPFR